MNIKFDKNEYCYNKDKEINITIEIDKKANYKQLKIIHGYVFYNKLGKKVFKKGVQYIKSNEKEELVLNHKNNEIQENYNIKIPIILPQIKLKYSGIIPYIKIVGTKGFLSKEILKKPLNISFQDKLVKDNYNKDSIKEIIFDRNKKLFFVMSSLNEILFNNSSNKTKYKEDLNRLLDRIDALLVDSKDESEKRNLKEIYKIVSKVYGKKNINIQSIKELERLVDSINKIKNYKRTEDDLKDNANYIKLPIFNEFLAGEIHVGNTDYLNNKIYNSLKSKSKNFNQFTKLGSNGNYLKIHNYVASLIGDTRIFYVVMGIITYVVIQFAYKINFKLYIGIIIGVFIILLIISGFYYYNISIQKKALDDIGMIYTKIRFKKNKDLKNKLEKLFENSYLKDFFEEFKLTNIDEESKVNINVTLECVLRTWYLSNETGKNEHNDETIYFIPITNREIHGNNSTIDLLKECNTPINLDKNTYIKITSLHKNKYFMQNKNSRIYYRLILSVVSNEIPDIYKVKYIG